MKSQRRHELQQNTLDAELARVIEFFKTRGTLIAGGILVAAVVVFVVVYLRTTAAENRDQAWGGYSGAIRQLYEGKGEPEGPLGALRDLASQDDYPRLAALASLELGNWNARKMLLSDGTQRDTFADKAKRRFDDVVNNFPDQAVTIAKAHFGLAMLAESEGDFETAKTHYERSRQGVTGYPIVKEAEKALEDLAKLVEAPDPVRMATTRPAPAATRPAPTTAPAATQPIPTTAPAGP